MGILMWILVGLIAGVLASVVMGGIGYGIHGLLNDIRERFETSDGGELDIVFHEIRQFPTQVVAKQMPKPVNFVLRALPVLDGEGVEREDADAEAGGGLDGVAHGLGAGTVAFHARQMTLRGPAAVAVHDDRDVRRQALEVDLAGESFVGRSRRNPRQELLKRHARPL